MPIICLLWFDAALAEMEQLPQELGIGTLSGWIGNSDSKIIIWIMGLGLSVVILLLLMVHFLLKSQSNNLALAFGTRRFRVTSLFFLVVLLTTTINLAWLSLEYNKRQVLKKTEYAMETVLNTATEGLKLWVSEKKQLLSHLANMPPLKPKVEMLLTVTPERQALLASPALASVREYFSAHRGLVSQHGFFVINPDYISIASMRDSNIGRKNIIAELNPEYLDRVFQGEIVFIPPIQSDVYLNQSEDKGLSDLPPTIFFAAPIKTPDGKVIAAITQRLDPAEEFSRVIQLGRIGQSGETYAFNKFGQLLSESRFEAQLKQTGLIKADQSSVLNIEIRIPGHHLLQSAQTVTSNSKSPLTEMAAMAISGRAGSNLEGYRDYRGVLVFGVWLWDEELGFGITSEIDAAEALEGYYTMRLTTISVLVVTMVLSVGAFLFTLVMGERANRTLLSAGKELQRSQHDLERLVDERTQELSNTMDQLKETQGQLMQQEKLASIGQLAAGVAHEINNPVGYVSSNIGSLKQYTDDIFSLIEQYQQHIDKLSNQGAITAIQSFKDKIGYEYLHTDVSDLINESLEGVKRVKQIVQDLKDFSREGLAEWEQSDIHQGLDSTLNIVQNELKYKADIHKEYGDIPLIQCIPAQLNQIFMNLLVNAGHAIDEHGTIIIRTGRVGNEVFVDIVDTGQGIPAENIKHLFEPFYTTKPIGQGTGLGLSLSYGIVKKHNGHIEVESEVGKGTCFHVRLPIQQTVIDSNLAHKNSKRERQ
jgi:signal transduction histidine kinase